MADIEVVQVAPLMRSVAETLQQRYRVHTLFDAANPAGLLSRVAERVRAVATNGHAGASAEIIESLPNLEIISCYGVGVDAIDLDFARSQGVIVTNTPDVLNDDVANMAVAMLLAVSRCLLPNDRYVRDGLWPKNGDPPLAHGIRGKKVGILGLGRIGKDIARKLDIFGCEISYHGRHRQPGQSYPYFDNLVNLAADCDYLIVICPGSEATRNIINADVIAALGENGCLINVARGSVVDEVALVHALEQRALGAAALDVFADEPKVPEALMRMENVLLQPHQGSATWETRRAMGDLMLNNLLRHFSGDEVLTAVVPKPR